MPRVDGGRAVERPPTPQPAWPAPARPTASRETVPPGSSPAPPPEPRAPARPVAAVAGPPHRVPPLAPDLRPPLARPEPWRAGQRCTRPARPPRPAPGGVRVPGKLTRAVSVAKCTVAVTPSSLFSFRSIRAAHDAQVIPPDRKLHAAHRGFCRGSRGPASGRAHQNAAPSPAAVAGPEVHIIGRAPQARARR
jgi:hypothetical protein